MKKSKLLIELDIETFIAMQKAKGWNESETAANIGVSSEQLWKVKKQIHSPGQDFIVGTLTAFPEADFDELFILPNSLRERKKPA